MEIKNKALRPPISFVIGILLTLISVYFFGLIGAKKNTHHTLCNDEQILKNSLNKETTRPNTSISPDNEESNDHLNKPFHNRPKRC